MPMHELAVCASLLRQVVAVALSGNASQILQITLRIGPLSRVEPDLLRAAFPLIAHGTSCEGAGIIIETIAVSVRCHSCAVISGVPANRLLCPACGTWRVTLVSDDEMLLARVELSERPGPSASGERSAGAMDGEYSRV